MFRTKYQPLEFDTGLLCEAPSLTMQEFRDDCDINVILKKMDAGVDITPSSVLRSRTTKRAPQFGDFTQFNDFQAIQEQSLRAREMFDALPSSIRERFGYDPGSLIEFVNNPANLEEATQLGLVVPKKSEATPPAPAGVSEVNTQTDNLKGEN